ncbi:hypothetical protein EJ05DRAFT_519370 [Pseudovirgaria hyperparasitica]|uniref:Uncharacterized protein n=1 Tax=Pseudovirgaria hyperparasitica TaxID=470096 RepID=A0A6A6W0I8_9PEZI|nr:uncharacterized protein EJ05DRAFT_519370 [Pseudovirgaria hyperparasitica]KAF2755649.1 hypothetical protein EJ05DRAFT_519370 [Pseudovirgaria hyperparasitica]
MAPSGSSRKTVVPDVKLNTTDLESLSGDDLFNYVFFEIDILRTTLFAELSAEAAIKEWKKRAPDPSEERQATLPQEAKDAQDFILEAEHFLVASRVITQAFQDKKYRLKLAENPQALPVNLKELWNAMRSMGLSYYGGKRLSVPYLGPKLESTHENSRSLPFMLTIKNTWTEKKEIQPKTVFANLLCSNPATWHMSCARLDWGNVLKRNGN